jgi:hypothetical protein
MNKTIFFTAAHREIDWTNRVEPALLRLVTETGVLFGVYGLVLFSVLGHGSKYVAILRQVRFWPARG